MCSCLYHQNPWRYENYTVEVLQMYYPSLYRHKPTFQFVPRRTYQLLSLSDGIQLQSDDFWTREQRARRIQ